MTIDVSRRAFMKTAGFGAIAAAIVGGPAAAPAAASGGSGKRFRLAVDTDGFADFQQPGDAGSFYVSGGIGAGGSLGTFHCWGFMTSGGLGVVTQEFHLDGRGSILVAGVESDAPRAVTGGTGDFANARGEGFPDLADFDSGRFEIEFHLRGAHGPPI